MNVQVFATRGERTRAHIVSVAAGLFWRRNFHGVAVDEVASAAEVNKATIYRYFADKRDLALAVVKQHGAATLEMVFQSSAEHNAAPEARLAGIYYHIYSVHAELCEEEGDVHGCPIVGLALELGQDMPEVRVEAARIFDAVEAHMREIAADAIASGHAAGDPKMLGRTLTQLLHGAFTSARLSSEPERILDAGYASLSLIGFPETDILDPKAN